MSRTSSRCVHKSGAKSALQSTSTAASTSSIRRLAEPDRLSPAHEHHFIRNDRSGHLQKIDTAGARGSRHHIHDVAIYGERHHQIGVKVIKGALDGLRHAPDHPERELAIQASKHPAAKDDIGTSVLAKTRQRSAGRIAAFHEAIEVVDQRTVALPAQIAQNGHVGEINARGEILPPPRRAVNRKEDYSRHQLSIAVDCALAARNGLLGRLMQRACISSATGSRARGHSRYIGSRCIGVHSGLAWMPLPCSADSRRSRSPAYSRIKNERVEPIVASRAFRLAVNADAGKFVEYFQVTLRQFALGGDERRQPFHLRAAERGVDIGEPVVVTDLVVVERPRRATSSPWS